MTASPFTTLSAFAELFEKDRSTLKRALRGVRPDRVDGKREFYKWKTIFNKLVEHERGSIVAGKTVTDEHRLLTRARREKVELEVQKVKGEVVDVELVSELLEVEYSNTREHFLSIPGACGHDLAQIARAAGDEMTATVLVSEKLRTTLYDYMTQWSDPEQLVQHAHERAHGRDRRGSRLGGNGGLPQEDEAST